jgi:hypothetical protein
MSLEGEVAVELRRAPKARDSAAHRAFGTFLGGRRRGWRWRGRRSRRSRRGIGSARGYRSWL